MAKILGSLLEKCNVLVTARDIVESANQMLDKLKKRLIKEEARKHVTDEMTSALHKSKIKQDLTESNRKEDRAFKENKVFKEGVFLLSQTRPHKKVLKEKDRDIWNKEKQKNNDSRIESAFSAEIMKKKS